MAVEQERPDAQPDPSDGASSPPGRSKLKLFAIGGGALLALIVVVSVVAYYLVPGINPSEPENTARYFPEDVLVYSWFTANPGIGQGVQMLEIWNRFEEIPEFEDAVDEMLEDLEDETGIDFEDDVQPWVGPDMSFAVLDAGDVDYLDDAATILMVGVRDHGAASDFLDDWLEYLEDDQGSQFDDDEIDNFEVWFDERERSIYALSKDWLVVSNSEDALEDVLDLISGDGRDSLADSPNFQEARAQMQTDRITSIYVDLEATTDAFSEVRGLGQEFIDATSGVDEIPDWLAVTARFVDRGLVIEVVGPIGSEFFGGFESVGDPANLLPDDSLGFAAASFDPDMDNWRAWLEDYTPSDITGLDDVEYLIDDLEDLGEDGSDEELGMDSSLGEILDYIIDVVEENTDIDLEQDFFDYLGGRAIVSVGDVDFDRVEDLDEYAVDAVVMLSHVSGGEEGLMDTMDEVLDQIESLADEDLTDTEDIGADQDAVVFDFEDQGEAEAYSPGYVLHGGYMTIGTTLNALEAIVDSQNGASETLSGMSEYQRARERLPDSLQTLMFVDLQAIISQLDPDDLDMDSDQYEILEEGFGAIALGTNVEAGVSRAVFVLTLFPE